jgi:membrane protein DedA with SNARE-associated domain
VGFILSNLINQISIYHYLAVYIFLVSLSFALPISEEVALILLGFIVFKGYLILSLTLLITLLGILSGDLILFFFGRFLFGKIIRMKFGQKLVKKEKIIKGERFFEQHGPKAVLTFRFIIGIRAAMFISAGLMKMKIWKFLLYDFLAAIFFIPIFFFVGYFLGNQFQKGVSVAERVASILFLAAIVFIGGLIILRLRRNALRELKNESPFSC